MSYRSIEYVPSQVVPRWQHRVIEVGRRIVGHGQLLHHPARSHMRGCGPGEDLVEPELFAAAFRRRRASAASLSARDIGAAKRSITRGSACIAAKAFRSWSCNNRSNSRGVRISTISPD